MNSNPSAAPIATASADTILEAPFYIPATGPASRPRRSLKSDDTFIVVDSYGDCGASTGGPDGLFHCDTRFLSQLELTINELQPLLLGSNVRDDNTLLTVDLTNPDMFADGRLVLHKDTLHIVRTIFLWRGTAYQRLAVRTMCRVSLCSTSRPSANMSGLVRSTVTHKVACLAITNERIADDERLKLGWMVT